MRMKMALVCAAKSCKSHEFENDNSNLVFFPFPDDEETCRTWVLRSGRHDLLYRRVEEIHLTEFLCERHFEDTCLDRSGSVILKPHATPTLFEPFQNPLGKEAMEDKDEPSSVTPDIVVIPCVIMNGVDTEVIGFDEENVKEENINRDEIEQELRLIHEGCLVDNNVLSEDTDRIEVHQQVSVELHATVNERTLLDPDALVVDGIEAVETCASYLKEWQDGSVSSLTCVQLCRVCGAENKEVIPVFGEQSVHLQIIDKIQWHLPIVVKEDDKLPLKICTSCVSLLNSWHDLVTTCMETDTKLRKLFNDEEFDPSNSVYCDLNPSTPDRVMEPSVRQLHDVLSSDTLESEPDNQNALPLDEISLQTTEDSIDLEITKDTQVTQAVQFFNRTKEVKEKSLRESRLGADGLTLNKQYPGNNSVSSKDAHQIIQCSSTIKEEDYEEMCDSVQSKGEESKEVDESLVSFQVTNEKSEGIKIELSEDSNEFLIDEGNIEEGEEEGGGLGEEAEVREHEEEAEKEEVEENEEEEEEAVSDNENNNVREGEAGEGEKANSRYEESRNRKMTRTVLCDLCGFSSNKKSKMLQHICDRHSSSASMFMCEYCDKMFTSEAFKEAHERSHINCSLSPSNQGQGQGGRGQGKGQGQGQSKGKDAAAAAATSSVSSSSSSPPPPPPPSSSSSSLGGGGGGGGTCFVCEYCGRSFRTRKTLKEHHIAMHSDDKPYKCDKCDKNYGSLSSLDIHKATHSSETPYLCDLCGKTFKHVSNLRSHKRSHLDDSDKNRYICASCGKGFRSRFHLSEHTNVHDGRRPYTCEVCGKSFHKKIQLRQHGSAHSGTQPFKCPVCGVKFNRRGNMTQHVKRHTQERKYTCRVCAASFPTLGAVLNHRKKHSDADLRGAPPLLQPPLQPPPPAEQDPEHVAFKCPTCGKLLAKKESLAIHMRSHTGEKLFPCAQCGKRLSNKGSLAYHVRSFHTGERPHACQFCGDGFLSKEARLVHERIHTGEKPFECDLCGMAFRCSSNLAQHARVHSDARPHACAACGKRFQRKGALDVHMRTHTGERPFACDLCGRAFTQKNDMLKHRRTHTLEKPFACALCPSAFARKRDLSRHRLDKHSPHSQQLASPHLALAPITTTMIVTQDDDDHDHDLDLETLGLAVKRKGGGGDGSMVMGTKTTTAAITLSPTNATHHHHHHHLLHPHHEDSSSQDDSSMHTVVITTADNLLSNFPGIEHTQTVILQRF